MNTQASGLLKPTTLPTTASIGLRSNHIKTLLDTRPQLGWLEIISDNFLHNYGYDRTLLFAVREHYDISMHGVGLNLGGPEALDKDYLQRLKILASELDPCAISEHATFTKTAQREFHDLLPLPYSKAALKRLSERIDQAQEVLGRQLVIENAVSYIPLPEFEFSPGDFFNALTQSTGCALLVDMNNLYINEHNFPAQFNSLDFLKTIHPNSVHEIHLAGFSQTNDSTLLIDSHSAPVAEPVWQLYRQSLQILGGKPTLIEWDAQLPELKELIAQAQLAQQSLDAIASPVQKSPGRFPQRAQGIETAHNHF